MSPEVPAYHAVTVGAGPASLSLAALYQSSTSEKMAVFERQPGPDWHGALLHPGVRMQTSWLKDLVSVVDPTHPLSFLNYLVTTGRLFGLLNAQFDALPRREYQRYLAWAAGQLAGLHYGTGIDEISFTDRGFQVSSGGRPLAVSEHLVLAVGTRPMMPAALADLPADQVFVADELGTRLPLLSEDLDAPIAVVGGGQTGCEAVLRLLGAGFTRIQWIGRSQWFRTIDDSPVANEFYRPEYLRFLQGLAISTRARLVDEHEVTGDALTPGGMRAVYQANYDAMLEAGRFPVNLFLSHDVVGAEPGGDGIVLRCQTPGQLVDRTARHVVVAAGREYSPIPFDADLADRIDLDENGGLQVDADFSVRWKGMNGHRIYALNRARLSHGIPDANLTLLPVRAAIVINSMLAREVFPLENGLCPVTWG